MVSIYWEALGVFVYWEAGGLCLLGGGKFLFIGRLKVSVYWEVSGLHLFGGEWSQFMVR